MCVCVCEREYIRAFYVFALRRYVSAAVAVSCESQNEIERKRAR